LVSGPNPKSQIPNPQSPNFSPPIFIIFIKIFLLLKIK